MAGALLAWREPVMGSLSWASSAARISKIAEAADGLAMVLHSFNSGASQVQVTIDGGKLNGGVDHSEQCLIRAKVQNCPPR